MTTCANCANDAIYTYQVTEDYLIHYCHVHVPSFLNGHRLAGKLALKVEEVPEPVVEVAPKSSKKKAEAPVEETPTEEVPITE